MSTKQFSPEKDHKKKPWKTIVVSTEQEPYNDSIKVFKKEKAEHKDMGASSNTFFNRYHKSISIDAKKSKSIRAFLSLAPHFNAVSPEFKLKRQFFKNSVNLSR